MLSNLSLRTKLSIYVGAAISFAVSLCISLFVVHAATRIRSESESALRLAYDFVNGAIIGIEKSNNPKAELQKLITEANNSRHIRVYSETIPAPKRLISTSETPPFWFSNFLTPGPDKDQIEFVTKLGLPEIITIESNPSDEIAEIWQEVSWISLFSIVIILLTTLIISIVVSKTISPVNEYVQALSLLDSGERDIHISGNGSPEFRIISDKINKLSKTLHNLDSDNHHLIQKMISLQDNERKELARDLHDDFGPALFMSRVGIGSLRKKIDVAIGHNNYEHDWQTVDQNLDKLQQINRRILGRLRPAALDDMGLVEAVEAMAQAWKNTNPIVSLEISVSEKDLVLDELSSLTAYRIIQEALTNIYRHSNATLATIDIRIFSEDDIRQLRIAIQDNGEGIQENATQGIGLRGMKERVLGAGGELVVSSRLPSGTEIRAILPIT